MVGNGTACISWRARPRANSTSFSFSRASPPGSPARNVLLVPRGPSWSKWQEDPMLARAGVHGTLRASASQWRPCSSEVPRLMSIHLRELESSGWAWKERHMLGAWRLLPRPGSPPPDDHRGLARDTSLSVVAARPQTNEEQKSCMS